MSFEAKRQPPLRWILAASLLTVLVSCGKNFSQILFHPSVEQRVFESLQGGLAVPAAIAPTDPNRFSFAVFGDIQIQSENRHTLARFKQDVATNGISFFVVLGDITENGSVDEFTKAKADLDSVGIPYYTTIGNHDLFQSPDAGGWGTWKTTFGAATYSVTIANAIRFILLDTSSGEVGDTQMRWFEAALQAPTSARYTIVGSHYGVHDGITPTIWRLESLEERYKVTSLLNRYGVYAYTGGHVHGFRSGQLGSTLHFSVGSMFPYELDYGTRGYLLFTYDSGNLTWRRVDWGSTY